MSYTVINSTRYKITVEGMSIKSSSDQTFDEQPNRFKADGSKFSIVWGQKINSDDPMSPNIQPIWENDSTLRLTSN